jgi:hypothetical protein
VSAPCAIVRMMFGHAAETRESRAVQGLFVHSHTKKSPSLLRIRKSPGKRRLRDLTIVMAIERKVNEWIMGAHRMGYRNYNYSGVQLGGSATSPVSGFLLRVA